MDRNLKLMGGMVGFAALLALLVPELPSGGADPDVPAAPGAAATGTAPANVPQAPASNSPFAESALPAFGEPSADGSPIGLDGFDPTPPSALADAAPPQQPAQPQEFAPASQPQRSSGKVTQPGPPPTIPVQIGPPVSRTQPQ